MAKGEKAREEAFKAISAIGQGFDITQDLRLAYCKGGDSNSRRLIQLDHEHRQDFVLPGGLVISNVSKSIRCDKGERMRYSSDVLSFQQMSEHFNQELKIPGKIPSGFFNAAYDFTSSWQKDASSTKALAFDAWVINLFNVEFTKSQPVLLDEVKQAVPSSWAPTALASFIEQYGTHIIVGVEMGGKDAIYLKQHHDSSVQPTEIQSLLKQIADERFSDTDDRSTSSYEKAPQQNKDITKIFKRRGGLDTVQTHNEWLKTVPSAPDVISMSFVPITSLLSGVRGSGFLSHAVNLYLRYKPPIEELNQFLEFQLPRQWAPVFSELPLGPQYKERGSPTLQFRLFGPKLYVNTIPVDVGKKPVTGVRLYLEGKKCNRLAIHLQHLTALPNALQLDDDHHSDVDEMRGDPKYYESVQCKSFSNICTAPVECNETLIGDPASIVTAAQLEVMKHGMKKVLFLKLRFSRVIGATIRRSEWDHSPSTPLKSGLISTLMTTHFTSTQLAPKPSPVLINSAVFPDGPPVPVRFLKLLKFVDTTEMTKGPQDKPGYWVVTGAKLCVERRKISLRVKYSLITISTIL
ncbi:MACPF domain-containing protein At4g24290 [Cryptomeria japonica]|uniref:MACPF domain-containing protein At4g24290 n=1 Tax=Cryptomeria japonica TaxID=3369 RepID=UPI0027DA2A71|nr:MACPF domain-containing protein At4g24290 [Cryptomeria japonica]